MWQHDGLISLGSVATMLLCLASLQRLPAVILRQGWCQNFADSTLVRTR